MVYILRVNLSINCPFVLGVDKDPDTSTRLQVWLIFYKETLPILLDHSYVAKYNLDSVVNEFSIINYNCLWHYSTACTHMAALIAPVDQKNKKY